MPGLWNKKEVHNINKSLIKRKESKLDSCGPHREKLEKSMASGLVWLKNRHSDVVDRLAIMMGGCDQIVGCLSDLGG